MKVNILASGSSGNCIALTVGKSTILVDAGIAKTKIEQRLLDVGIIPSNIKAIFISHAHKDHTKGLPLANKYNIPVYAGHSEWQSISFVEEELRHDASAPRVLEDFDVKAFDVHHDAFEPLGFTAESAETKASICFDTGQVDVDMLESMSNSDIYILEANHEPRMVEASDYPDNVKARVLSHIGHLSNEQTARALCELIQGKNERIYLTHLSSSNNMSALAEMTAVRALTDKGLKQDKDYKIEVI